MQQVILTFANNSKARLDALGLSVEGVTTKAAELEAQGFVGDAFDEAVLIGLEEKMTLLGDASETTAGQLQQLEADWANLTNALKQGAAQALGPLVSQLAAAASSTAVLKSAYDSGAISAAEYALALEAIINQGVPAETVLEELGLSMDYVGGAAVNTAADVEAMVAQAEIMRAEMEANVEAASSYDAALLQLSDTYEGRLASAQEQAAAAAELLAQKQANAAASIETVIGSTEREVEQLHRMTEAGLAAAGGMSVIIPAADNVGAAVDRANAHLEKLLGYMNSLDGRSVSANVNVSVSGLDQAERAAQLLGGGLGGGAETTKTGGGAKGGSGGVGVAENAGTTVVQNNYFPNPTNPNAIATATAEKLGQLK